MKKLIKIIPSNVLYLYFSQSTKKVSLLWDNVSPSCLNAIYMKILFENFNFNKDLHICWTLMTWGNSFFKSASFSSLWNFQSFSNLLKVWIQFLLKIFSTTGL